MAVTHLGYPLENKSGKSKVSPVNMEIKQMVKGYPTQEFPAEIFRMGYT